ncbi:MAG: replicative DNA helicase [Ruminobacter sp.]|jgi:replicative DNA helicase|uniref:Replicative DNA helicase n=1 Tax=Ruminobacter amylophilus TaxID=867 RepID=A0A662ZIK0_9GAMM|nr:MULTISPECIES: replicative DNA helicase [Ruminobacter]MBQ3775234.1 replicative DNA helicase [Ruminobacter sp.]SFP55176.1 replicative DNA helicase [Ruminobacter amylophilus]
MPLNPSSPDWHKVSGSNSVNDGRVNNNPNEPLGMPHDFEAEQAVLGSLLLTPNKLEIVNQKITAEDFFSENHKLIYSAILRLSVADKSIDIINLADELKQCGQLEKIGGQSYLLSLQSKPPTSVDILSYTAIVNEKSQARKILNLIASVERSLYVPNGVSVSSIRDELENNIIKLGEENSGLDENTPKDIKSIIFDVVNDIRENNNKNIDVTGVTSGYTDLDKMTAGFHAGELIIVGARPAMGKTTFGMNLVENMAFKSNPGIKPVLVFSIEMNAKEIVTRLISSMAHIEMDRLKKYRLDETDLKNMLTVATTVNNYKYPPIFICDGQVSAQEIRAITKRLCREYNGLGGVMVDYLQRINFPNDGRARHEQIGEASWILKSLAKELQIPVIALAQVARDIEKGRKDKRPMNADLRESGSIEQDADVIMFVHREEVYQKDNPEVKGKAEIIISKQRNGPTGIVDMFFQGNYARFTETAHTNMEQSV